MAYTSLVRPKMEYCSTVWDPHTQKDIDELEKVNRRAARVVNKKSYWERDVSPTELLQDLGWGTLAERRKEQRLTMMYKIKNNLVAVPSTQLVAPQRPQRRPQQEVPRKGFHMQRCQVLILLQDDGVEPAQ